MPAPGSWQRSLGTVLLCVVGVRLFLTVEMALLAFQIPVPWLQDLYSETGVPLLAGGWEGPLLGVWQREDALWYQKIATVGYSSEDMTAQLFPLFPMLMRAVHLGLGIHPVMAGIAVSELSLVVALFLLHRLLVPAFGARVTDRTLVYLSLFPSAFFLHAPFSESLMLMLAILAFYLISRGRWMEAAFVGYLAGLTRPQGMLLGPALAVALVAGELRAVQWRSFRWNAPSVAKGAVLVATPFLGLWTFQHLVDTPWARPGVAGGPGPMAHQWLSFPGTALVQAASNILYGTGNPIDRFDFVLALLFLFLTIGCLVRLNAGYAVYSSLFLLAPLSRYSAQFPLMSLSRFCLLLFPCFLMLALSIRRTWTHCVVLLVLVAGLMALSAMFYMGYFVG